jgi:hypothetical protein
VQRIKNKRTGVYTLQYTHETEKQNSTWKFVTGLYTGSSSSNNNNNNNNNKQKRENMNIDRCGNTRREKCRAEGSGKKSKYKSLCIEIQRMWDLKCTIIPVIIGATGIVTRSLRKNLEDIPGKHSIDSLQKTAILGISLIIRKALQCET